ncbi:MAG: YibE/F family protein [Spirochaetales bacterium]|nr:YibE/F family protein [Spirochaetales bacterium]
MIRKITVYLFTVTFSLLFLYFGNYIITGGKGMPSKANQESIQEMLKARVIQINNRNIQKIEDDSGSGEATTENISIEFTAKILNGYKKGMKVPAVQTVDSYLPVKIKEIEVGDKILLCRINDPKDGNYWMFAEYLRSDTLLWLGGAFIALLIVFGHIQGINTILSLTFTCVSVFYVLIPAILAGKNIYFWAICVAVFITAMTLLIVYGTSKKALCAAMGCLAGTAVSGGIASVTGYIMNLTGVLNDESLYLLYLNPENPINLKAITFAAILIGAIGAIMDVAISLSSALYEVKEKAPDTPANEIFRSGLTIGRDMMGTMANTLVLAYIGSSLSLVLLLIAYRTSWLGLFNRELIVAEILQTLSGSIGILFTIPLTSLICAWIYTIKKRTKIA